MAREYYPSPHPYVVLGLSSRTTWTSRGRPVPAIEAYRRYQSMQGAEASDEAYSAWSAAVEKIKVNNSAATASRPSHARTSTGSSNVAVVSGSPPADPTVPPPDVPSPFETMPHLRSRAEKRRWEVMSVRVSEGINARLDRYRAALGVSKQEVVSDVLDAFLTSRRF